MFRKKPSKKSKFGFRAQAIVEFAIALPIMLAIIIGIFEVGRLMFIYAAVTNASRNASRFASAVGYSDGGYTKYNYCWGIRDVAERSTYLVPITAIEIYYDDGLGNPLSDPECNVWNVSQVDTGVKVSSGDRVTVIVTAQYRPMLNLIPISQRTITSQNSRTILGVINLDN